MNVYRPMLAATADEPFDSPEFSFEIKWDGYRAIAYIDDDVCIRGRGSDLTMQFSSLCGPLAAAMDQPAVLDGEIVAFDDQGKPSFHALRKRAAGSCFVAFDLLWHDGEELIGRPLRERRARLSSSLHSSERIRLSEAIEARGREFYEAACALDLEGVMAKRLASRYRPGERSAAWLKLLVGHEAAFNIIGFYRGTGGSVTALELTDEDGRPRGRVSAPAERWLGRLRAQKQGAREPSGLTPITPGLRCRVRYREITPDGRLRHPIFLHFES